MHLGLAEADQTFLRWVLRRQQSWLIRRHLFIKNTVVQADGDLESRLGFGDTGVRGPG